MEDVLTIARTAISTETASKIEAIVNSPKGGFISVRGFRPKYGYGEVQNAVFCKGADYEKTVANSLKVLENMENDDSLTVEVTRGTWTDANGNANPTNRKSQSYPHYKVVHETYRRGDGELEEALLAIRKSLTNPQTFNKDYTKVGNGVYLDESGVIHIRDLRKVSKNVIVEGKYPQKATSAKVAIQNKLKSEMPIGNYRQFRLDGDYDLIKAGGNEITHDVQGEYEIS